MGDRIVLLKGAAVAAALTAALAVLGFLALPRADAASGSRPSAKSTNTGPPHARRRAKITGASEDGRMLTASMPEGSWTGATPMTFTYQWQLCEPRGHVCNPIPGATEASYRAISKDVRHKLRVLITAMNEDGTATRSSRASKRIKEGSPLDLGVPQIEGSLIEGTKLTALPGEWVGTAPIAFAYQWERCELLGGACEPIEGATSASYTPEVADLGARLAVVVTASNFVGKAVATSTETLPIEAVLPTNLLAPTITGLLTEGSLLKVEPGLWEGTGALSYLYQWELCNSAGQECSEIEHQSGSTLKLLTGYIGDTVEVLVTAKDSVGSKSVASAPTSLIAGLPPADQILPSISGGLVEGDELKVARGEWSGTEPIAYSYAWELCNSLGKSCNEINGAAGSTLPLITGYIGDTIEGVVTATNVAGETSKATSPTELIKGIVPSNTGLPSISGGLVEGDELKVAKGEWSGTEPIAYSYAWELCNSLGKSCNEIKGAAGSTLPLITGYIGDTIEGVVTATNVAGETSKATSPTELIKGIVPSNTGLPSITGSLLSGQLLSATSGTWSGTEPISYAYQWQLCNPITKACSNITGALGSTLKLSTEDIGSLLDVIVTAKNVAGSKSATSGLTGEIGV